ncbi:hypothetical protein JKP88DRAFT_199159 [Tribonema minus]|uniref:t-SNARE coiled-coil homology domain-containing protein n=1 Tax=Tribonema minus TaxID=303371 RepID=A0A835YWI7_9STRA|nr:hypothetical protein JKP88DRAFT_199159 [Tribonema minus]
MNNWKGGSSRGGMSPYTDTPDYSRLPRNTNASDDENDWIRRQVREHKTQVAEQDRHLEDIGRGVERLGEISLEISKELDGQNKMLSEMEVDYDEAIYGMEMVTKKTKELIKTSGGPRNFCIIAFLVAVVVVLLVLVIYT